MGYRDDSPRCPKCAEPAVGYDAIWDYLRCANNHRWDGPQNDPALRGKPLPSDSMSRQNPPGDP